MELFNTQALNNKSLLIHEHILEKRLDFMCLVETWHKPRDYLLLTEVCPSGYNYMERARTSGRGGGLLIIHWTDLELSPLPLPDLTSMECLAFKCKPPYPMTVLLIYCPPKPNPSFLPEIHDLITSLCTTSDNVVIIGDINIHVDNPSCPLTAEYLSLLECLGLQQHVEVPTHNRGHTLDLAISNSASFKSLEIYDLGVSDHKVISSTLNSVLPAAKPKRQITFRNLKRINSAALATDLQHITCPDSETADELVEHYNIALSSVLDLHASVKRREVTFKRSAPWYTQELRSIKTAGRALERQFKHTGLTVHKLAFREHQKTYAQALKEARSKFYSNLINKYTGNSEKLFSTINRL